MAGNPRVEVDIVADGSKARKEIDTTAKSFKRFGDGVKSSASRLAAGAAGLGLAALITGAGDAATELERTGATVDRVFGDSADTVKRFADTAAETAGLSASEYQDMATKFGTSLANMGLDVDDMATKSNELAILAGDIALATGVPVTAVADAISAAMRGETDAIEAFGVDMDKVKADAEKAALGAGAVGTAAYDSQYNISLLYGIMDQAGGKYGGFRDETDTTAEKQQELNAKWENAQAMLGEKLIPILGTLTDDYLIPLIDWISGNSDAIARWVPWILVAVGAVWLLNVALAANPIVLVTVLVLALVVAFIIFKDQILGAVLPALSRLWDTVTDGQFWASQFSDFLHILGIDADSFRTTIDNLSSALNRLWDWLQDISSFQFSLPVIGLPEIPTPPGGLLAAVPAADQLAAAPAGASRAFRSAPTAGVFAPEQTTIVVQGALDPDAVARQIERILTARGRRVRRVEL